MDPLRAAAALSAREQLLIERFSGYSGVVSALADKLGAISAAVAAFRVHEISYALIGGLAVGVRSGVPRATLDVDFAVATTFERGMLVARLEAQGFHRTGDFPHSVNFKHSSGEPVQLAFDIAFDPMIERAELLHFGDLQIYVVTTEDLIMMKRRAAADPARRRSKALRDEADIALLEGDVPEPDEGW